MYTILVIVAAFVGVAALVGGIAMMLPGGGSDTSVEDRLSQLTNAKRASVSGEGKPDSVVLTNTLDDTRNFAEALFARVTTLRMFFEQADSPLRPGQILAISAILTLLPLLLPFITPIPWAAAPAISLCFGVAPFAWLFLRRRKRLAEFGRQLPEALELIGRALRAGHSLASGLSLVASEMADPIAREFCRCYEEQNLGIPLEDSLEDMTERVPNLDLRFFVTAVILQRQTGGDLAEILDKIGHLIRERFKIWGQIQALTGEGRLSGVVLLALPPVLFVVMFRLNPVYCKPLFTDPMGHQMLAYAIVMQVLGALVIRKIINIKV